MFEEHQNYLAVCRVIVNSGVNSCLLWCARHPSGYLRNNNWQEWQPYLLSGWGANRQWQWGGEGSAFTHLCVQIPASPGFWGVMNKKWGGREEQGKARETELLTHDPIYCRETSTHRPPISWVDFSGGLELDKAIFKQKFYLEFF